MKSDRAPVQTIDDYLRQCSPAVRRMLRDLRAAIRKAAPEATEKISYQMPTFFLNGNLVHFAACEHHIGFYPAPSGVAAFAPALTRYKTSKGAIQFPLDQPLPLALVTKIVKFRVRENTHATKRSRR